MLKRQHILDLKNRIHQALISTCNNGSILEDEMSLLTIKEVAKRLKISLSLAYGLVARGEIPCYEIGTCKRVDESDLQAFLDQRRKEVTLRPQSKRRHF